MSQTAATRPAGSGLSEFELWETILAAMKLGAVVIPFELESVVIEHPAVAEAAVVPQPDPIRLAVPKAYVVLAAGFQANQDTARDILRFTRQHLAPYKRIRRIEFAELPKTSSGKIRRVQLRAQEQHGPREA